MTLMNVEGIILRTQVYKENSRIVNILTPNKGKITAIGHSSQKLQSPNSATLQVGNLIQAVLYKKQENASMSIISQAKIIEQFKNTKSNLMKLGLSQYAIEVVNKNTEDGEVNPQLYNLLKNALYGIENGPVQPNWKTLWDYHLLSCLGFKPVTERCVITGKPLNEGIFDVYEGGLTDKSLGRKGYYMGSKELEYFHFLSSGQKYKADYPVPTNVKRAIDHMVNEYAFGPFVSLRYYGLS